MHANLNSKRDRKELLDTFYESPPPYSADAWVLVMDDEHSGWNADAKGNLQGELGAFKDEM